MSAFPDIRFVRSMFPGLQRELNGQAVAFFDGPAGSQVPGSVAEAVSTYLLHTNANRGAAHATSVESDFLLNNAHHILADFLGADDPETICFGANMTTITLAVSRALARSWKPGDEIILSRLDHDANVTPWVLAAEDVGVKVNFIDLHRDDWTLDLDDFQSKLSDQTRIVAVGLASNATGTINPVRQIVQSAQAAGALTYIDAVHYAPHGRISVAELGCDFLVCSAYKFFGPHVGVLYGRRPLLEGIRPFKLRPSPDTLPGRWMTGTQNHEGIVGAAAAVEYLASLCGGDGEASDRRTRLDRAFAQIRTYEQSLSDRFLRQVALLDGCTLHGLTDMDRVADRVPTFSMTFESHSPQSIARQLAERGVFAWAGNHYALPFTETAGLEPDGTFRVGALHYNTPGEIDRLVDNLRDLLSEVV